MNRIETITVRCSPAERSAFQSAAACAGMSVSAFARRALLAADPAKLRSGGEPEATASRLPPPRRPRPLTEMRPFRAPFLRGVEGAGFERVVRYAARMMRVDDATMARACTYLAEGIANAFVSGQCVRWPGLFVAGPYRYTRRDGTVAMWPRFQSSPPLNRTVREQCTSDLARNVELDSHRKHARRAGVQTVEQVMETCRRAIQNQDLRALRVMEDWWRHESAAHAI